jgi:hypothetical protein
VIESVLKMTKAPTKRAIPAKASRKYSMKLVNSLISSLSSSASAVASRTWASSGRTGWISETSCSGVVPSAPATEIVSTWPSRSRSPCAVARSKMAKVAVPSELTSPIFAMPTTSKSCFGRSVEIATVSPTS